VQMLHLGRRALPAIVAAALWTIVPAAQSPAVPAAQAPAPAAAPVLSDAAIEAFLTKAQVVSLRNIGTGTTNSRRATLSDGTLTHDAHVQIVDEQKTDRAARTAGDRTFFDSYRYNIAAYRLARLVGLHNVPPSVERTVDGSRAAVTWWLDDVLMDEKERKEKNTSGSDPVRTGRQIRVMHIWDELIHNTDRNQGNIIWARDWSLWLIDHTRSFQTVTELMKPGEVIACDTSLLAAMRGLTQASIAKAVGESLTRLEIQATLSRRDQIVKRLDAIIAKQGEASVLFTLP
jgi:hypothetical protein